MPRKNQELAHLVRMILEFVPLLVLKILNAEALRNAAELHVGVQLVYRLLLKQCPVQVIIIRIKNIYLLFNESKIIHKILEIAVCLFKEI